MPPYEFDVGPFTVHSDWKGFGWEENEPEDEQEPKPERPEETRTGRAYRFFDENAEALTYYAAYKAVQQLHAYAYREYQRYRDPFRGQFWDGPGAEVRHRVLSFLPDTLHGREMSENLIRQLHEDPLNVFELRRMVAHSALREANEMARRGRTAPSRPVAFATGFSYD